MVYFNILMPMPHYPRQNLARLHKKQQEISAKMKGDFYARMQPIFSVQISPYPISKSRHSI